MDLLAEKPRPLVMGILNVTPDSFSDGGIFLDADAALHHAQRLVAEGADLLDVGGESSRPGAQPVSEAKEAGRVIPLIEALRHRIEIPISIDTVKAVVARAALAAGADWINDISALRDDPQMATLAAESGVPLVLMHRGGTPGQRYQDVRYHDVIEEIKVFFDDRIRAATAAGVRRDRLILDPGIGFGKTAAQNCLILNRLREFRKLGLPLLVGASRKSFIGTLLGVPVQDRLPATIASTLAAAQNGADIVRVHDVAAVRQALSMLRHIQQATESQ